jgi:hypothetical protein
MDTYGGPVGIAPKQDVAEVRDGVGLNFSLDLPLFLLTPSRPVFTLDRSRGGAGRRVGRVAGPRSSAASRCMDGEAVMPAKLDLNMSNARLRGLLLADGPR